MKSLGCAHEEEETQHAQDKVTLDGAVLTDLEMVHADFTFAILEHPFDVPAAEGHVQQYFERRVRGRVGKKVFQLPIHYVTRHEEPTLLARVLLLARKEPCRADFPHDRSVAGILDVKKRPRRPAAFPQLIDAPRDPDPHGRGGARDIEVLLDIVTRASCLLGSVSSKVKRHVTFCRQDARVTACMDIAFREYGPVLTCGFW